MDFRGIVGSRVGNRENAEDLTSRVFLKASRQPDSGCSERSMANRLFTVARTVLADHGPSPSHSTVFPVMTIFAASVTRGVGDSQSVGTRWSNPGRVRCALLNAAPGIVQQDRVTP